MLPCTPGPWVGPFPTGLILIPTSLNCKFNGGFCWKLSWTSIVNVDEPVPYAGIPGADEAPAIITQLLPSFKGLTYSNSHLVPGVVVVTVIVTGGFGFGLKFKNAGEKLVLGFTWPPPNELKLTLVAATGVGVGIISKEGPIGNDDAVISPVNNAKEAVFEPDILPSIKLEALNAVYVFASALINHGRTAGLYWFTKLSKSCSFLPVLKLL